MSISNLSELGTLCRFCLSDSSEMFYKLDSDFSILVMENGKSITIGEAINYLSLDIKIPPFKSENEENAEYDDEDEDSEHKHHIDDDPNLPKSLCQVCLEQLQTSYEFKFRCEENRNFLKNYLKECADSKLAEERAVKDAALAALDLDLDNLDNLPDKLVLKQIIREKKPRKPRDPTKGPIVRRRRIPEKNVIMAEDSQVESPAYIRKMVTTPEQSPDQKHASKRKSKHVIIEDVFLGAEKSIKKSVSAAKKENAAKEKENLSKSIDLPSSEATEDDQPKSKKRPAKKVVADDEPIFEDDPEFVEEPKRTKRSKK